MANVMRDSGGYLDKVWVSKVMGLCAELFDEVGPTRRIGLGSQ